jgi:VWFA-related protein
MTIEGDPPVFLSRRIAILLSAFAVAAVAQMQETLTVNVVEVPVTVVDSSGNPVRGLTAANFKLYDAGKEVPVNSFDMIDFASKESMSAVSPMNPAGRRNFMLLFDLSFSKPKSLAKAQDAARQFVAKAVQPRDLVGVGTIDSRHGFHLVTSFTTDRKLVAEAITNPGSLRSDDPLHLGRAGNIVDIGDVETAGKSNAAAGSDVLAALVADSARLSREAVMAEVGKQMDFMGDLAKTLRSIPGRKQLVYLTEGFDPRMVAGSDAREDLGYDDSVYSQQTDRRFGSNMTSSALQRMATAFRGSDVVLHALDIQGLRVENDMDGGFVNSNDSLRMMAEPTGGMVFKNANKIEEDFTRMMRAQEVVYVLAFQASVSKPGKFHDLKVKLVNTPAGTKAFARAGYYEGGGESKEERTLSNAEIIMNDIAQDDLHVAALAAPFATTSENSQVPVILEIDGNDILKDLKVRTASAEIYLYAFDSDGTVRDRMYQRVGLDINKVGDKLRAKGMKYYATLSLPPGKYAIKALVTIAESQRKGFARADLVVPKASEMTALPVFVEEQPRWVMVKGTSHDKTNAAYPFEIGGEQFIPAATARTKRIAVFVPNAKPGDVTFETTPKVKFLGAANSAGATALVMELEGPASAFDITVHRRGVSDASKASVRLTN